MRICICIKSAGKRKPVLEKVSYEIPDSIWNVKGLISEIVRIEVEKYNAKGTDEQIISFLTNKEVEAQAEMGKIGFGRVYSDRKADAEKAVENALQSYEDGIVRIFQNEVELTGLDTELEIREDDVFTFIRLVFLSGRMW